MEKEEGGLEFESFQHHSLALKIRWCGKLMEDVEVLWVSLAKESISRSLDSGPGCRTKCYWSATKGLMLDNCRVVGSPLLRDLVDGLYEGRNALVFETKGAILPVQLTVEQILILFNGKEVLSQQELVSLRGVLRAQQVTMLEEFWDGNGEWRQVESFRRATRRTCHRENASLVWLLEQI